MRDRDVRWKRAKPTRYPLLRAALRGHLLGLVILAGIAMLWRP